MKLKEKKLNTPPLAKEGYYWHKEVSETGVVNYHELPLEETPIELTATEIARKAKRAKLENATEEEKKKLLAHLSPTGHYLFAGSIMLLALVLGLIVRGWLGFFIVMLPIAWVLFTIPTSIHSHRTREEIEPGYREYRIDHFE